MHSQVTEKHYPPFRGCELCFAALLVRTNLNLSIETEKDRDREQHEMSLILNRCKVGK
ncbi:unnamed protein product [Brassica oleracea var. botrytis]